MGRLRAWTIYSAWVFVLLLLISESAVKAEDGPDHTIALHTPAASFLKMRVGARMLAMGGAGVAGRDTPWALFVNPAILGGTRGKRLAFSYHRSPFDVNQMALGSAIPVGAHGGLSLGVNYVRVGDIKVRTGIKDDGPEAIAEASDLALCGGYAREIIPGLHVGIGGKFLQEKLYEDKAASFVLDLGVRYAHELLDVGAAFRNIGGGIRFDEESFSPPTMGVLGVGVPLFAQRLRVAVDFEQPLVEGNRAKLHMGCEGRFRNLYVRAGYTHPFGGHRPDPRTGWTAGIGFLYDRWQMDYGVAPSETLGDVHQVSMAVHLPLPPPPMLPPVLHITSPQHRAVVEDEYINVIGRAEDDKGITRLEIWVNGEKRSVRQVGRKEIGRGIKIISKWPFSKRVRLNEGDNLIEIVAYDTDNLQQRERRVVSRITKVSWDAIAKRTYAVIVGISKYASDDIDNSGVKYTAADALAFKGLLEDQGVPEQNIRLLVNENATSENIKSALWDWLPLKAYGKAHRVIIFYAGHGILYRNKGFFVTYESDPDKWGGTALPMDDVNEAFDMIGAGQIVFFSDACHSGVVTEEMSIAQRGRELGSGYLINRFSGEGRVMITASKGTEKSIELPEYKHGLFSYFLLEGLRGEADRKENGGNEDGWVDIDEAYDYTYEKVTDKAAQLGCLQHPQQDKRVEGKFHLSKLK